MAEILLFFLLIDAISGKFHLLKLQVYKLQPHKLNTFHTIKKKPLLSCKMNKHQIL